MTETKDFIELGVDNVLTKEQIDFIKENPSGLTKEGCAEELKNWNDSSNKPLKYMYAKMLKYGKSLKDSRFTKSGDIVFAIKDGKVTWLKKVPKEE